MTGSQLNPTEAAGEEKGRESRTSAGSRAKAAEQLTAAPRQAGAPGGDPPAVAHGWCVGAQASHRAGERQDTTEPALVHRLQKVPPATVAESALDKTKHCRRKQKENLCDDTGHRENQITLDLPMSKQGPPPTRQEPQGSPAIQRDIQPNAKRTEQEHLKLTVS